MTRADRGWLRDSRGRTNRPVRGKDCCLPGSPKEAILAVSGFSDKVPVTIFDGPRFVILIGILVLLRGQGPAFWGLGAFTTPSPRRKDTARRLQHGQQRGATGPKEDQANANRIFKTRAEGGAEDSLSICRSEKAFRDGYSHQTSLQRCSEHCD